MSPDDPMDIPGTDGLRMDTGRTACMSPPPVALTAEAARPTTSTTARDLPKAEPMAMAIQGITPRIQGTTARTDTGQTGAVSDSGGY